MKNKHISETELAKKLSVSKSYVNKILSGERKPNEKILSFFEIKRK
jgi:transcriptional regulator with XRE-family HTH domain